MFARIYRPAKTAMQSGRARTKDWVIEFERGAVAPEKLMGWQSTADTSSQVRLAFDTREEAIAFGRVFRQNTIVYAQGGRPELIVTDPTADDVGRSFYGNWRVRT
jgi:hypothetical protein